MSREVKFRFWNIKTKTMTYDLTLRIKDDIGIKVCNWIDCISMQYTGLKDKKRTEEYPEGQPIYEGDILKGQQGDLLICWYSKDNAALVLLPKREYLNMKNETKDENWWDIDYQEMHEYCLSNWMLDKLEIIGNVTENPELLEVQ